MKTVALRGMTGRKLRTVLTALSIVLGTAMISGTFIVRDQITHAFGSFYDDSTRGTDVALTKKTAFTADTTQAGPLSASLIDTVKRVDGVQRAEGQIGASASVVIDGKTADAKSAGVFSSLSAPFNTAIDYTAGNAPSASGQIAVNRKLAEDEGLKPGGRLQISTQAGLRDVTVSGVFDYAGKSSLNGSTLVITGFPDAQQWFDRAGETDRIDVAAATGVSPGELKQRIAAVVPSDVEVLTGAQSADDQTSTAADGINGFLTPLLLAFAGAAVFVGAFIIFNTFSITVAQRTRELAMLRTIGASRRQVLGSVLLEAVVIGVGGSLVGIAAGILFAVLLNAGFGALGLALPTASISVSAITVVLPIVVGTTIAVLAAIGPAFRATRVPPIAALREGAELPPGRFSRFTPWLAGLMGIGGLLLLVQGIFRGGATSTVLIAMAAGAMLVFIAVAMLSKYIVRPLARVIGWPVELLSNTSGRLARENSLRNPGRTAVTSAALMIGVGLVVFVGVFVNGFKDSFLGALDRSLTSDLIIQSDSNPLPSTAADTVAAVPGVAAASGLRFTQIEVGKGAAEGVNGIDPATVGQVYRFDWTGTGSDRILQTFHGNQALLEQDFAKSHDLAVGQRFTVTSVEARKTTLTVVGIYKDPVLISGFSVPNDIFDRLTSQNDLGVLLVTYEQGASADRTEAAVKDALAQFPQAKVRTNSEYKSFTEGQVNQVLTLLYVLLAMSVVISLFGIVNTLALSVFERTREIGMMRAIGMTRPQLRRVVRYEALITAVIGGLLGIGIGVLFGWMVTKGLEDQGVVFSPPYLQLAVSLVVAGLAGILAAILPARRAAGLNILDALKYE
jgi:putative ABC transport system permease protein